MKILYITNREVDEPKDHAAARQTARTDPQAVRDPGTRTEAKEIPLEVLGGRNSKNVIKIYLSIYDKIQHSMIRYKI